MTTKKDLEIIAEHMKVTKPIKVQGLEDIWKPILTQWESDVKSLSHALQLSNPRFDQDRFFAACGYIAQE